MSEVEPNLKSKECCVCLEDFPRQMSIPCHTCKYSTCKTCVDKLTITETTDYNYPHWEDTCYWNEVEIINCPMCRQSMVSRIFHNRLQDQLWTYAHMYLRRNTLEDEIDFAYDNYCAYDWSGLELCHPTYTLKIIEECIKDWELSQTPLMRKWISNHLSDPDIVTDRIADIYQTPSAKLIEAYWIRRAKTPVVIRRKPNWGPTDLDHWTN